MQRVKDPRSAVYSMPRHARAQEEVQRPGLFRGPRLHLQIRWPPGSLLATGALLLEVFDKTEAQRPAHVETSQLAHEKSRRVGVIVSEKCAYR